MKKSAKCKAERRKSVGTERFDIWVLKRYKNMEYAFLFRNNLDLMIEEKINEIMQLLSIM